ncbi:MAG: hypothetical protein ACRD5H_15580, partial [Nitrososphaerales archaeon]
VLDGTILSDLDKPLLRNNFCVRHDLRIAPQINAGRITGLTRLEVQHCVFMNLGILSYVYFFRTEYVGT